MMTGKLLSFFRFFTGSRYPRLAQAKRFVLAAQDSPAKGALFLNTLGTVLFCRVIHPDELTLVPGPDFLCRQQRSTTMISTTTRRLYWIPMPVDLMPVEVLKLRKANTRDEFLAALMTKGRFGRWLGR